MATADTALLIATLELQDKFSKTADRAVAKVDRIDKKLGAFSGAVNRNLGRAVDTAISRGVRALTSSVTEGLGSLAELEDATTAVDGAIKATGKTGQVTSGQIARWANEIETNVQAAFDDKAITNATGNLLRFGKVTTDNIRPAMEVMTDLAAKTGDVDSASNLLAKALADPTKAAGKLARQGVVLTKQQQKQIAAFVKAGETGKAQGVILDALAKTTGGAAANSAGKYRDTLNLMTDASEDAKKALAEGFFPVIQRVSSKITELANDPETLQRLRDFGTSLAGAFDKAIDVAEGIDWSAMGAGLKAAAGWAQRVWDAFNAAPAEAKGMIIALAGLSKLTGGAPIKIAVDFAKDALGGVFGHFFDRGSSPANPMFVSGTGIAGGEGGTGTGIKDLVKFGVIAAIPVAVATAGAAITQQIGAGISTWVANGNKNLQGFLDDGFAQISSTLNPIGTFLINLDENLGNLGNLPAELGRIADFVTGNDQPGSGTGTDFTGGRGGPAGGKAVVDAVKSTKDAVTTSQGVLDQSILAGREATLEAKREVAAKVSAGSIIGANASRASGSQVSAATGFAASRIVGAINAIPAPQTFVDVDLHVSSTSVTYSETQRTRSSTTGSRSSDNYDDHR